MADCEFIKFFAVDYVTRCTDQSRLEFIYYFLKDADMRPKTPEELKAFSEFMDIPLEHCRP